MKHLEHMFAAQVFQCNMSIAAQRTDAVKVAPIAYGGTPEAVEVLGAVEVTTTVGWRHPCRGGGGLDRPTGHGSGTTVMKDMRPAGLKSLVTKMMARSNRTSGWEPVASGGARPPPTPARGLARPNGCATNRASTSSTIGRRRGSGVD